MQNVSSFLLACVTALVVVYSATAFIAWDYDPAGWVVPLRLFAVIAFVLVTAFLLQERPDAAE